jgi:hypothetical protein
LGSINRVHFERTPSGIYFLCIVPFSERIVELVLVIAGMTKRTKDFTKIPPHITAPLKDFTFPKTFA